MIQELSNLLNTLHPAVIHFPIAGSILALLALLCGAFLKKDWLQRTAAWLWVMTFLFFWPAFITGYIFALHLGLMEHFQPFPSVETMKGRLLEHVLWAMGGFASSCACLAGALGIFRGKPWPTSVLALLGLALATTFGLAGNEGGEMVYGGPAASPAPARAPSDLFQKAENYRSKLVLMNSKRWFSKAHGRRWVNVYVSPEAVDSYRNGDILPEGTVIVKDSLQDEGGKPSTVEGPLWIKVKGKLSDAPGSGGWLFGLKWEHPVLGNPEKISMPVTWLPGDPHLSFCVRCHGHFKLTDFAGGVPEGYEK